MWNQLYFRLRKIDGFLFFAFITLVCFGLLAIYSITLSQQETNFLLFKKQLIALGLGLCLFWIFWAVTGYCDDWLAYLCHGLKWLN